MFIVDNMGVVRKILIFLIVAVFAVSVSSSLILAKEDNDSSRLNPVGVELKDNRADLLEKRQELKEKEASRVAEVKAKFEANLTKRLTNVSKHLSAYLERLDKIASKIDSRIKKLKARGVDTKKAESKLGDALVLGGLARSAVSTANADIASAKDKASVQVAMASIKSAQKALFAYHKGLVDALRELKVANGQKEGSGSAVEVDK